ncbi:MAG: TonB C-terminal domain-containing protein [Gallionella sp.]|nr:TonB C-terminal domain-containing protein [Gallionella sp.]
MTATTYREPYQFSAGVLALLVHGVFFAVLYFGLSWQTKPPMEAMSVELWDALPMPAGVPTGGMSPEMVAPDAAPALVEPPPPAPIEVAKPDIVVPEKKPPKPLPVPQKLNAKPTHTAQKPVESNRKNPQSLLERYGIEGGNTSTTRGGGRVGQQLRLADAVKATEVDRLLAEYIGKIKAKIKRDIVMPPDVPENARVEFLVTLLPDGSVMTVRLARSSHAGYANAVERAIFKAQPLPLPPNNELFGQFRELKLVFKPIE